MKVECCSVSVGYADYLAQAAPHNRRLLDRWIVVTKPSDEETRSVCAKHSIEIVLTDEFDRDGVFSKARGINAGLRQMKGDGFLLHMDADIVLPYDFGECLEDADLQPGNIYGCHRLCVPGWDAWQKLQEQGLYSRMDGWLVEYRDRPAGCYVGGAPAQLGHSWGPIGFWQFWWGAETLSWGNGRKWYPTCHGGAARTDTNFAALWPRRNRVMIPELLVFHLEAEDAKDHMGANWNGRTTPRFGPPSTGKSAAMAPVQARKAPPQGY